MNFAEGSEKKAVEKYLGEPVFTELTDNGQKIRRNLLLFSTITVFLTVTGISVNPDTNPHIYFFELINLNAHKLYIALLIVNLYLLIHFFWICLDSFAEWTLRQTGHAKGETIYSWWLKEIENAHALIIPNEVVCEYTSRASNLERHANDRESLDNLRVHTENVRDYLKRMQDIATNGFLEKSLKKFDNRYRFLYYSQNLRWLLVELLTPLVIGFAAVLYLIPKIFTC